MQQGTYVSLNTQAMKLKLNSNTLKDKVEKITSDSQAILTSLQMQDKQIQNLATNENKDSRDFYSLVNSTERSLSEIHKKNDEVAKKLTKTQAAATKLSDLKTKLLDKYNTAINNIKPEDQKNAAYDFTEFKAHLNILENNYSIIEKSIASEQAELEKRNVYYDKLQTLLSSFNIDKLKKNTTKGLEKVTKNIEALANIYPNTSELNQKELQDFIPQLKLNIEDLNHKSNLLFGYANTQTTSLNKLSAANDGPNNSKGEAKVLKLGK